MKLIKEKNSYRVEGVVQCYSCTGTGLYNGFAEKGGARVICYDCEGIGKVKVNVSWNKFTKKKIDKNVIRVYQNGMGYAITDKDVTTTDGKFMPFSKYGCSYKEWLNGAIPKPLEFLGCPYLHTNQKLQSEDKNDLYKTRCKENIGWGSIRNCKFYPDKDTCWKIYKEKP